MQQRYRRLKWFWLSALALSISGCATRPQPETAATPPGISYPKLITSSDNKAPTAGPVAQAEGQKGKAGAGVTTASLSGPVELPIDLPTVLRLAGTDALEVKLAQERLAEAEARRLAADFQFLPTIQPGINGRWHRGLTQAVTGEFLQVRKQSSFAGLDIAAEWRLGESIFQSLAARRRVAAGQAGVQASRDDARLQAVNAYFNLVLARADQAVVEERIKQADETVRMTQELLEAGAGLLSEVKRSQAARAEVRQRLAAAKEKVRLASLELTDALNIDPMVSLTPRQEPQDLLNLVPAERKTTDLVSAALQNRPELEESRTLMAALENERKAVTIGPLIPTLKAEALTGGFGPNLADTSNSRDYALGLQWNIGRGGLGDISRSRLARSQQRQEQIRFEKITDQVAREVIAQQTHVEAIREQITLSQEEISAAEAALNLSRERMQSGAALTIEVLNAEDLLFDARLRAAQEISEYNKAQYGLLHSIGGFRALGEPAGAEPQTSRSAPVSQGGMVNKQ